MIFTRTKLPDSAIIDVERRGDERGYLARVFCEREFADAGLPIRWVQGSSIYSPQRHTLRGLHFQEAPHAENFDGLPRGPGQHAGRAAVVLEGRFDTDRVPHGTGLGGAAGSPRAWRMVSDRFNPLDTLHQGVLLGGEASIAYNKR